MNHYLRPLLNQDEVWQLSLNFEIANIPQLGDIEPFCCPAGKLEITDGVVSVASEHYKEFNGMKVW